MSEQHPPTAGQTGELETLMQRYQEGDSEAAAMLVTRLSPQIYRLYVSNVRDRATAEDLLQDFWLRMHKARHTYRLGEPALPWVYAIARRVRIDQYRRNRGIEHYEVQNELLLEKATEEAPVRNSPDLTDLLKTLPDSQREVILLMKVSGLSLEETARATGTSVGAVKQKTHRAYEKLRKLFGRET